MARSPQEVRRIAQGKARKYGLDEGIFVALVRQESGFRERVGSPAGAQGAGQLMPGTARALGVRNVNDARQNLDGAARYLKQQLKTFGGDYRKALAAYNAGPGAVQKYKGVPPFRETQNYVRTILGNRNPKAPKGGGGKNTSERGGGGQVAVQVGGRQQAPIPESAGTALADQLAERLQAPQPVPSMGVQAPSFSATRNLAMASAGAQVPSSGPPVPKPSLTSQLAEVRKIQGAPLPQAPAGGSTVVVSGSTSGGGKAPKSGGAASGKIRDGGGYSGTRNVVATATAGFPSSSEKRSRKFTANGNISDHWEGNKSAYAKDIPAVGAAGDRIAATTARRLGIRNYKPGNYNRYTVNVNGRRYSVQILWRVAGHGPTGPNSHVHVGVKRV